MGLYRLVMASDPNWVLSTTAQSTAALVAIAGGFVLSRVIALGSERSGLHLRLRQLETELASVVDSYHSVQRQLDDVDWGHFDRLAGELLAANPTAEARELIDSGEDFGDLHSEELAQRFEQVRAMIVEASERIGHPDQYDNFRGVKEKLQLERKQEGIYRAVWEEALVAAEPGLLFGRVRIPPSALQDASSIPMGATYGHRVRDRDRLLDDRQRIVDEVAVVRTALAKVSGPSGLGFLTLALVTFLILGVVLPLVLLGAQPTRMPTEVTGGVVGAFCTGLALTVWAVIRTATQSLSGDRSTGQPSTSAPSTDERHGY